MNCKIAIVLTIFVIVVSPAHFCVFAAEPLSEIEGEISGKEKNRSIGIPPELITIKLRKRDPGFAISVETVLRKVNKKDEIILIDIRNSEEFEKLRIPGSINIPLFAIKTKTFLKHKPHVLINEGYRYAQLEQECKRLRDVGFTVSILNGGLHYWRQKGGALTGDVFAQKELNKISPRFFFVEKDYENWIMIDSAEASNAQSRYLIPQAIHIPYPAEPEQFVTKLKAAVGEQMGKPFIPVLVFDDNGENYEDIEKLVEKAGITTAFYLKGGLEGYRAFLKQQVSIWQRDNNSRKTGKTVKKCVSCP